MMAGSSVFSTQGENCKKIASDDVVHNVVSRYDRPDERRGGYGGGGGRGGGGRDRSRSRSRSRDRR